MASLRAVVKEKEKDVQRSIIDYLTLRGIFFYRNNSGAFKREDGHFYRFGALGSPDIVIVRGGQYIGCEVKGTIGKQSDHQKEFEENLVRAGGRYILARSLDDFLTQFGNT